MYRGIFKYFIYFLVLFIYLFVLFYHIVYHIQKNMIKWNILDAIVHVFGHANMVMQKFLEHVQYAFICIW